MSDNVNHPKHYSGETSFECIEVMEMLFGIKAVIHFCLLNAFKYLWRYNQKNGVEDLCKAEWYINYADEHSNKMSKREKKIAEQMTEMLRRKYEDFSGSHIL